MEKKELLKRIILELQKEIKEAENSLEITRQTIIDAPGAMQSHSDTTRSQMSRLAEETQRSIAIKNAAIHSLYNLPETDLARYEKVVIGSLVETESIPDGKREWYFLLPEGGGIEIESETKGLIFVITAAAPLADHLFGKCVGDTVAIRVGSRSRQLRIISIQ